MSRLLFSQNSIKHLPFSFLRPLDQFPKQDSSSFIFVPTFELKSPAIKVMVFDWFFNSWYTLPSCLYNFLDSLLFFSFFLMLVHKH